MGRPFCSLSGVDLARNGPARGVAGVRGSPGMGVEGAEGCRVQRGQRVTIEASGVVE